MVQDILNAIRDWTKLNFVLDSASDDKLYVRKNGTWVEIEVPESSSSAGNITFDSLEDDVNGSVGKALNELNAAVFPLEVSWLNSNSGTFEVGTSVTPTGTVTATRKGTNVSSSAVLSVTNCLVSGMSFTAPSRNSGTVSYTPTISQGGLTKTLSPKSWSWTYYRYRGEINSTPTDFVQAIQSLLTQELTTVSTLSGTNLSANKMYLFAVKGIVNLVCRENSTNAILDGCTKGTCIIDRKNGTDSDTYSYILIPKSSSNWTFKITNS